jgi:hypothetical protein
MTTPIGDYTHAISGRKSWPALQPIDYQTLVASTDANYAIAGRVAHLNSSGLFEAGATAFQMPMYLVRSATSFDVATTLSNSWGGTVIPTGSLGALVAAGAYELESTEFDTTVNFAPNTLLKSPTRAQTTNDTATTGLLYSKKGWNGGGGGSLTLYTDTCCGVASFGSAMANGGYSATGGPMTGNGTPSYANYTGPYKVAVLAFWPVFIPGTA